MGLFSKDKPKRPKPEELIAQLRGTEEMMQKKIAFLEKKIEQEVEVMKKNAKTNKRAALQALGRKKRYEKQIGQLEGTLSTLEMQRETLEQASFNREVYGSMQSASQAMKSANEGMSVENINKLMDEIHEQKDTAEELTNAISSPIGGTSSELDEDDLMAELKRLESEDEAAGIAKMPSVVRDPLPVKNAPAKDKKKKKEEEDMDQLQAWLA